MRVLASLACVAFAAAFVPDDDHFFAVLEHDGVEELDFGDTVEYHFEHGDYEIMHSDTHPHPVIAGKASFIELKEDEETAHFLMMDHLARSPRSDDFNDGLDGEYA